MRPFGAVCEMCGQPHLSCYIPLGLVALVFLVAACYMAMPIALEFRSEVRWMAGFLGRALAFRVGRHPAPALADNVVSLWGDALSARPALREEQEAAVAEAGKAA